MRNFRIPIYIVLFLIGGTSLWYFGHHRPAQKILTADPVKIYSGTPEKVDATQVGAPASVTPVQMDTTPEEDKMEAPNTKVKVDTDTTAPLTKNGEVGEPIDSTLSEEPVPQDVPSDEEVAAFKDFSEAQSSYEGAQEELMAAFDSEDPEQIGLATKALRNARLKRKDTLEKLAVYSEDAAKLFIEAEAAAQNIDERMAAFRAESRSEMLKRMEEHLKLMEEHPQLVEKHPQLRKIFEDMLDSLE